MAKDIIALKDFDPKGSHSYIIDTNMWVYLFSPIGSTELKLQDSIGKFIEACKRVNANLVTTSFIVSEYFHVTLGFGFDRWKEAQKSSDNFRLKRDYRPTTEYKDHIEFIKATINQICKITTPKSDKFETIQQSRIIENSFHAEFFDNYTLEMANNNDWIIITNDKDLLAHPDRKVTVVTP